MHKSKRFIIDAHIDLAADLYNKYKMDVADPLKNDYLDELKANRVKILISSLFVSNAYLPEKGLTHALDQLQILKDEVKANSNDFMIIKSLKDLEEVMASDKIGIVVSLEGLAPIGDNIYLLKTFYELGVRGAGLTWARRNAVADGTRFGDENDYHQAGITAFGKSVIEEMDRLGMFIDISHLNDAGAEDVFRLSNQPILASHSNARAINPILRNIPDELVEKAIGSDGLVCINNLKPITGVPMDCDVPRGIEKLCDHIDHFSKLVGNKRIGFGFDLCNRLEKSDLRYGNLDEIDIDVLDSYGDCLKIAKELSRRGYSEESIDDIFGNNMLAYLKRVLR